MENISLKEVKTWCANCEGQQKPFSCQECEGEFLSEEALKEHKKIHTDEKPFSCPQCEDAFLNEEALKEHMETHSDEKPFSCLQCDYEFMNKEALKEHMKTHYNERPFSCPQCEDRFVNEEDVKEHVNNHADEKPFKCTKCEDKFGSEEALKEHEENHTDEKHFKCAKCGERMEKEEILIEEEEEVAKIFNKFFPEKVEKIAEKIPIFNIDPTSKLKEKLRGKKLHFYFKPVTEKEVIKAIKDINSKTSSGVDFISTKVLKMVPDIVATPLCYIINNF